MISRYEIAGLIIITSAPSFMSSLTSLIASSACAAAASSQISQISSSIDIPYTSTRNYKIKIIRIPIILPTKDECKIKKGTNNLTNQTD